MLVLSGYEGPKGGKSFMPSGALKSMAKAVQTAKSSAGIPQSNIPQYKSPLLKKGNGRITPQISCKGGQIIQRGQCIWPDKETLGTAKDLVVAEKRLKQIEGDTKQVVGIGKQASKSGSTATIAAKRLRRYAGYIDFSGYGQDEGEMVSPDYQEQEIQSEEYQEEPFNIDTAKRSIIAMQEDVKTIENAVIEGKKAIAEGKKQIEDGRKQIAAM